MNNTISMSAEFERQKNIKATALTLGIGGALLLLSILVQWSLPVVPPPPVEEYIEVNLGSGDLGSGNDQPLLPGEPAPAEQTAYTPPQPAKAVAEDVKDVETDDRDDNVAAPVIKRPTVTKPNATKINDENKTVNPAVTTTPQPVTQAPRRPKNVMGATTGGNGNGGNGADTYRPSSGEGVAGGPGDQGVPGGSPNGRNYSGTPRNFGVKVLNIPAQSFEDDFNENAKIAMDITTSADGKVVKADYQPRGSTSNSRNLIEIARRRAFELKNVSGGEGPAKGTVIFQFKVRS